MKLKFLIQRKHLQIYTAIMKEPRDSSSEQTSLTTFFEAGAGAKYGKNNKRQKLGTDALVSLIAKDMLSLSLVESLAFKKFVHTLDPRFTLPSCKHLSTKLLTEKQKAILIEQSQK